MGKELTPDEISTLRRMIRDHIGFGPHQKPLTYDELGALRSIIADRDQASMRVSSKLTENAMSTVADLAKLKPPVKTSQLIAEAAHTLNSIQLGFTLDASRDWNTFISQLYSRARQLRAVDL